MLSIYISRRSRSSFFFCFNFKMKSILAFWHRKMRDNKRISFVFLNYNRVAATTITKELKYCRYGGKLSIAFSAAAHIILSNHFITFFILILLKKKNLLLFSQQMTSKNKIKNKTTKKRMLAMPTDERCSLIFIYFFSLCSARRKYQFDCKNHRNSRTLNIRIFMEWFTVFGGSDKILFIKLNAFIFTWWHLFFFRRLLLTIFAVILFCFAFSRKPIRITKNTGKILPYVCILCVYMFDHFHWIVCFAHRSQVLQICNFFGEWNHFDFNENKERLFILILAV